MTMGDVVWIPGANGMLGRALTRVLLEEGVDVVCTDRRLDIADVDDVRDLLKQHRPARVINCAGYTAVDRAESEPAVAQRTNADGPRVLAAACRELDVHLVHVSTDYVFDGKKSSPYVEDDPTAPLSAYGRSKRDGEGPVLAHGGAVVRTSWLYGPSGKCFPATMIELMKSRAELRVVDDQRGRPTYTVDLARALSAVSAARAAGVFHFANAEPVTWHGFAVAIRDEALRRRMALKVERIEAIPTSAYPTPATRPANSVLDTRKIERELGVVPRPWLQALREYFDTVMCT
jgi:dTDP-4-dehydrorhamnose reductase